MRKKRILFIAAREASYPRVRMTLDSLREIADVDAIVCENSSYWKRLLVVGWKFVWRRKSRYDALFVGFFAQPIMPLVRLFWRKALLVDAFISLYDSLVLDKGLIGRGGMVAKLALYLDRITLESANVAFVDTLEHGALYSNLLGDERMPELFRLWAGAEEDIFSRLEPLDFDLASGERFEVLFWGGFIPLQGVDVIVRAASLLNSEKYRITIVGTGQTHDDCRTLADELNVKSLEFEGWKTPHELKRLASRSHLLLGIFGKTEKAKRVIPNKAFQALALGKPLLTGRSKAISELLEEDSDVLLCPMADESALAEKIEWASENWDVALAVGRRGFDTFREKASGAIRSQVLQEALRCIVVKGFDR